MYWSSSDVDKLFKLRDEKIQLISSTSKQSEAVAKSTLDVRLTALAYSLDEAVRTSKAYLRKLKQLFAKILQIEDHGLGTTVVRHLCVLLCVICQCRLCLK